ncbi:MAG: NAD(P)/FAD-dependent oxidoreductase [Thaumarchaeota archaeon]|nr:NAD(P)/FAD-dependent oxidoreductase [Nitrososphaerota archaeon]
MIYDLAILGGGPAGTSAASTASAYGARIVLIEKSRLGGQCLNTGCYPLTKLCLFSRQLVEMRKSFPNLTPSIKKEEEFLKLTHFVSATLVPTLSEMVRKSLADEKIDIVYGEAQFFSRNEVSVEGNDGWRTIRFRHAIICTGSVPNNDRFSNNNLVDNFGVLLEWEKLPRSVLLIECGFSEVELAFALNELGIDVTVIKLENSILSNEEGDIIDYLILFLQSRGIKFINDSQILDISRDKESKQVELLDRFDQHRLFSFDKIITSSRKPNYSNLDLPKIGVKIEDGLIQTNRKMQTSLDNIYAAGEVTGKSWSANIASEQGIVASLNCMGEETAMDYELIPKKILTYPEFAAVGLTTHTAKQSGRPFEIVDIPISSCAKAQIRENVLGLARFVLDPVEDTILGVHIVCPDASEVLTAMAFAIKSKIKVRDLLHFPFPHPTYCELIHHLATEKKRRLTKAILSTG